MDCDDMLEIRNEMAGVIVSEFERQYNIQDELIDLMISNESETKERICFL